ncbi:hypothetical protein B0H11DRAFT_1245321 [Mycena galericulata]|nr:hypothetical protein B0H11DRAFT_1245321 [Mycena galericulata]
MPAASRLSAPGYPQVGGAAGIQTLLSATVVSTLFYGVYFVLFVIAVYLHSLARRGQHTSAASVLRSPVFIGIISLFVTITAHWVMTIIAVYNAFQTSPDSPLFTFYEDPLPPIALVRDLFLLLSWSIGDLIIIHRLWTVWSHNKFVIIFPLCTWLGLTASGIGQGVVSSLHSLNLTEIFPVVRGWFTSQLVFTLCTTVYCTVFFTYRTCRDHQNLEVAGSGNSALMTILANVVESALIYTVWVLIAVVTYQMRATANIWVFESSAAGVGVVNMLIYVRVGLGWAQGTRRVSGNTGPEFGTVSGQLSTGFELASVVGTRLGLEPGGTAGSETELEDFKTQHRG